MKADRVIRKIVGGGQKEFIIYPFGELGMLVKDILNKRYGIKEKYIVDNYLGKISSENKIITLNELKDKNISSMLVLLASDGYIEPCAEIWHQLTQYVPMEQIVDVFSVSMYFDEQMYYEEASYKIID